MVKFFHWRSSPCGGVLMLLFYLPVSAMSRLKSPHKMCIDLFGDFNFEVRDEVNVF